MSTITSKKEESKEEKSESSLDSVKSENPEESVKETLPTLTEVRSELAIPSFANYFDWPSVDTSDNESFVSSGLESQEPDRKRKAETNLEEPTAKRSKEE